ATVYRSMDDSWVLLLSAHHIAVDGTSLFLLFQEAVNVYGALCEGRPVPPPQFDGSFSDFGAAEQEYLRDVREDRHYWTDVLTPPPPPLDLPASRAASPDGAISGESVWHRLDSSLASEARDFARAAGVTDYVLFLSVWYAFLM